MLGKLPARCDACRMPAARTKPLLLTSLLLASAPIADSLASKPAQQWRDGWGLAATSLPAGSDTPATVLRLQPRGQNLQVWAEHGAHGHHLLRLRSRAGASDTIAPQQRLLSGPGRQLLAELPAGPAYALELEALPGRPLAAAAAHAYTLPFDPAAGVRVHQAAHGSASHHDLQNRHAWDFALAEGSVVLAARGGRIMATHGSACCPSRVPGDGGNWVRVEHADGSMAIYAHLQPGSLQVRAGQAISTGQALARVGNTGYSTAPHLHFAVQLNDGQALRSIGIHMNGPQGRLQAPAGNAAP